jgi:hypothetical protein
MLPAVVVTITGWCWLMLFAKSSLSSCRRCRRQRTRAKPLKPIHGHGRTRSTSFCSTRGALMQVRAAWEVTRNATGRDVDWRFTIEDVRIKLQHLIPCD